jgi:ubiquinone/menaquinone biosynthesis C-methylase UbiE
MRPEKDALGQEVKAYFEGKKSYEIIERDDNFIALSSGPASYFGNFKTWSQIEKKAIKFVRGKVLDIGAGVGRVALWLQKRGFDVIAIDNSPLAVGICKKRGVKKAKILSIDQIAKFKPNTFNTIIMFGNNFGLFGGFKKARKLLSTLYRITGDNALIITESNDPYKTNDPVHLSYHRFNTKRGRMPGQLRMRVRFRNYIGNWFDYLIVSKKEMKKIIKKTGWKIKKFISSKKSSYIAIIEKE